jgi:hypothetical protein
MRKIVNKQILNKMNEILIILASTALLLMAFIVFSFAYSVRTALKQDREFRDNLKVGDVSNFGVVSEINGEDVIIKRDPLLLKKNQLCPKKYQASWFFMFNNTK